MDKPKPKKRKKYDWAAIEREWRTDQFSNMELGRIFGPNESAIRKRAERYHWKKDLKKQVNALVASKLQGDEAGETGEEDGRTDAEIAEAAAQRAVELIRQHRKDIARLREEEQRIMAMIEAGTKLYITQYQGEIVEKELGLTVTEQATALNALANVQQRRIALERQAYNLGDTAGGDETNSVEVIMIGVNGNG